MGWHRILISALERSFIASGAGRLRLIGVVSGDAAARGSLVAYAGGKSSEPVRFARGSVRRALPGMLRLVLICWHARVLGLFEHTTIRSEKVVRCAPIPIVERKSIGVVFFASSGLHGSAEYVRHGCSLAFEILSATTGEEGDEEE